MKDCLTCKWMDEPDELHKYHICRFPVVLPKIITATWSEAIDITKPFKDCPAWAQR